MNKFPFYDLRLQITNSCPQKCKHCFADSKSSVMNEITLKEISNLIVKDLVPRGLKWVTMTGGEPLLRYDDCLSITKLCRDCGVVPRINTGGYVKNVDNKVTKLIEAGIETIMLPLKSTSPTAHDSFCGIKGVFENTIRLFKLIRKLNGTSCLRVTLFNWNREEIPNLLKLARDIKIDKFRIRPELPAGRSFQHSEFPSTYEISQIAKLLLHEKDLNDDIAIEFLNPFFQFLYSDYNKEYQTCTCGITKAFITSKGDIKPCGFYKDSFGNILKESFNSLWEEKPHPVLKRLRSRKPFEKCKQCKSWDFCKGGCPVIAYNENGALDGYCRYCPIQRA